MLACSLYYALFLSMYHPFALGHPLCNSDILSSLLASLVINDIKKSCSYDPFKVIPPFLSNTWQMFRPCSLKIFSTGSRHWLIGIYLLCLLSPFFLNIGLPQLLHHPFASFFISPILSFWYLCLPIMSRHSFPPFFSRQWLISPFASRPQDCLLILTNDIFPPKR